MKYQPSDKITYAILLKSFGIKFQKYEKDLCKDR